MVIFSHFSPMHRRSHSPIQWKPPGSDETALGHLQGLYAITWSWAVSREICACVGRSTPGFFSQSGLASLLISMHSSSKAS